MKTTFILAILAILLALPVFGQQEQTEVDPFYYQVAGLVYVKEFNATTRAKTLTQKIPKEPLKFKIVSKEIDLTDNSTYYVIKFLPIKSESDEIVAIVHTGDTARTVLSTLRSSTVFVNSADNDKYFWIRKDELDNYIENGFIVKSYKVPNVSLTYGANLSLPFKLRSQIKGQNIKITPDLTIGGYLGFKWRISHSKPFYVSFPVATLGLATLAINDNNSTATPDKGDGTVLGITGSTGLVFQLNDFQFGIMIGWDRAAGEIGRDWIYNNQTWSSFSIGYSFLGNAADKDKTKKKTGS